MARRTSRPTPTQHRTLPPARSDGWACCRPRATVSHPHRTSATLDHVIRLTLPVRRCQTPSCARVHQSPRPQADGRLALPQGGFGLEVIAFAGPRCAHAHRSLPEIQRELRGRGVAIAHRTVTNLLARSEEPVSLQLRDDAALRQRVA